MKTNAPERLYLSKNIYNTYLYQVPDPDDETAVEYTRIDAFIEKAVEWLKLHSENDYVEYHMGVTIMHKDKFIKDFKDAIERI